MKKYEGLTISEEIKNNFSQLSGNAGITTIAIKNDTTIVTNDECTVVDMQSFLDGFPFVQNKTYIPARFLASCAVDVTMQQTFGKLSARQYTDLALCLQNSNFVMLSGYVDELLSGEIISQDDVSYFIDKLKTEEGVEL
jgi:hypothetical protein